MAKKLLFVVAVGLWVTWGQATPVQGAHAGLFPYCGDGNCDSDGCPIGGPQYTGNGCEEDGDNCPADCPYCGDGQCNVSLGENESTCPDDCGSCGDEICQGDFENPDNCSDCPACTGTEGNECTYGGSECSSGEVCNACHYCAPANPYQQGGGESCPSSCYSITDCEACTGYAEPICYSPGSYCFVGGIPEEGRCIDLSTAGFGTGSQGSEMMCPM